MRVAVFYIPPPEHPLTRAAASWLGRDPFSGADVRQANGDGMTAREIAALTEAPRRYGFHATLKAPFRLADGCRLEDVDATLEEVARSLPPVDLGHLEVSAIGSFFALTPSRDNTAIGEFAAEIVRRFDTFRLPPTAEEMARRRPQRLSERQRDHLERWGYPYVFEDFRFHMTLTGEVPDDSRTAVRHVLEARFGPLLDRPAVVDALALFVEPDPPGDFLVRRRIALGHAQQPVNAA